MKQIYNLENIKKEALKYNTKKDFFTKSSGHYAAAKRLGVLPKVCSHMLRRQAPNKIWNLDSLTLVAQKYSDRNSFQKNDWKAYRAATKMGLLDTITQHMDRLKAPANFWTREKLQEEALKYTTKKDFFEKSTVAYCKALNLNILDEISSHMTILWQRKWDDKEKVKEKALKYKTRKEFAQKSSGAYARAIRNGYLDECCSHMQKSATSSAPELDLFSTIKSRFPKAQKFRDANVKIPNKPHIKKFDMDVYIPELRKGIEFDGGYWHSFVGLKRGRPTWPEEDLQNYHQLKDEYFKSKGIEIFHIKEEEWLKNKETCLKNLWKFLGK